MIASEKFELSCMRKEGTPWITTLIRNQNKDSCYVKSLVTWKTVLWQMLHICNFAYHSREHALRGKFAFTMVDRLSH